jgi:PAS domain S-box-containing protein
MDSAVKYWNRGAEELYGWTAEEATGKTSHQLLRTIFPAPIEQIERELVSAGRWEGEMVHTKKDGSQVVVASRWSLQRDEHSTPVAILEINNDITERKRAEEALRESEAKLEEAQRIAHVGYWDRDLETDLVTWSDETYRIYGLPPEERVLTLDRIREQIHPDDRQRMIELAASAIQGRSRYDVEYRVVRPNGEVRIIHSRGDVTRDKEDRPRRMFGTVQDITERRAREAAEAANRAKDEFLANVSHEIRTPMNAILGMTELTLDTQLTEDQRQCLRTVKAAADNLLGIIDDLLDFSKIEAGKLELDPHDFSLQAVVGDTLRALAVRAHNKGLELIYQVQPDVPDALVGDAGRLRQVLLNLVGNALKFTEEGEVVVGVDVDRDSLSPSPGAGEVGLRFTVRDTGIGIPPEKQESIFRAFEQEDTSTTRKYGGTGLGLTIASRLVALMGGTLTVDSEPSRGSTFAFTARFGRQPHQTESAASRPPVLGHNLRVLIVDDNATNRHILEEWLRGWQMEPTAVGDGLAALDALWDAVHAGRPYALVLLDARMPDTDGLALAAKIRKRAELSATRIILLTSGDRPGDLARSREQGLDARLLKPVQQDELLETIFRVMSRAKDDKVTRWQGDTVPEATATAVTLSPCHPVTLPPCQSWWPRTTSSTPSCWSSCWGGAATACGWRPTAGRPCPWRERRRSTCCSWTSTCRSWTASRSSRRSANASGRRGTTCPSSP